MMKRSVLLIAAMLLVGCGNEDVPKAEAKEVKLIETACSGGRFPDCRAIFEKDGTRLKLTVTSEFVDAVQKDTVINLTYNKIQMKVIDFDIPALGSKGEK